MKTCPNRNSPEWKALEEKIGAFEAMRDFLENNEKVRSLEEILADKPDLDKKYALSEEEGTKVYDGWDLERVDDYLDLPITQEVAMLDYFAVREEMGQDANYLKNPITLDAEQNKNTNAIGFAQKLATRLASRVQGVKTVFITADAATEILANTKTPYNQQAGFFLGDTVYFVQDAMTTELVFHEFSHPIVRAISIQNPELFSSLYDQLSLTEEGRDIIARVALEEKLEIGSNAFKEEAIVRSLAKSADTKYKAGLSSLFLETIKNILYAIRQFFRKILFKGDKIQIEKLSPETTMQDLADLLMNKEFAITEEALSENDVAAFSDEIRSQLTETLSYIENSDISKISKAAFSLTQKQARLLSTKNFSDIKKVLSDKLDKTDLSNIMMNLRRFQNVTQTNFSTEERELEYKNAHSSAIIKSLLTIEVMADKMVEELKRLSKDVDNKDSLRRAAYINSFIRDWSLFLEDVKATLDQQVYRDEITVDNKLRVLVSTTLERLKQGKSYTDVIYTKGVTDTLVDQLEPMKAQIEEFYERTINKLKAKNAPKELIKRYEDEFEAIRLTPERIKSLLKGELGDAGAFNSFFEGYMNNQDPVIFGFAGYVKDRFTAMAAEIQQNYNSFLLKIEPLLKKAGYTNAYSRMRLGQDITFRDIVKFKRPGIDRDEAVYKFLTPWVGFEAELDRLQNNLDTARQTKLDNPSTDNVIAYVGAIAELAEFKKQYMNQEYIPEVYDLDRFFIDEVGQEANRLRREVLADIQGEYNALTPEEVLDRMDNVQAKWKEYHQLFSTMYTDGTEKPTDSMEYKVAMRLQEWRKASSKYYKWTPRKGAFQKAYLDYLQFLKDSGIKGKKYDEMRASWLEKNMVRRVDTNFYNKRADLYAKLAELQGETSDEVLEIIEQLSTLIGPYKDQNFIPTGSEMPASVQQKIKDLETDLKLSRSKMKLPKGMTTIDLRTYNTYQEILKNYEEGKGPEPTEEETKKYTDLLVKMKKIKTSPEKLQKELEINRILNEIFSLSKKTYTEDYINSLNDILTNNPKTLEYLKKTLGISEFSSTTEIDTLLLKEKSMINLAQLIKLNKEFKEWFFRNHIGGKKDKKGIIRYSPTKAWTYDDPVDSSYLLKTEIFDEKGNKIEELDGVPSIAYSYREVKPEYRTERITYLDCIRQGRPLTDATVSMTGKFLPKLSGGDKFRNDAFFNLKDKDPKKYDLLIGILEAHLEFQETLPYDSRLDIDIPRYRKTEFEVYTGIKQNPITAWFKRVKSLYTRTADDLEEGMNPVDMANANKADLYDDSMIRIPITGMYNIEDDQVSLDVIRGIARYQQSGIRQKTLINMLPTARALQAIVQNPDNDPNRAQNIVNTAQKAMTLATGMLYPERAKGLSIRAKAINSFIEREFEGKSQAGLTKDMVGINKAVNQLFSLASTSFFALNIPSSYKNSFGARFQSMIEAAGGKYFNFRDYTEGSTWAVKATSEISMQLYKFGPKSLDVQLVEMMDPAQGRLTSKISQGTGTTRSLGQDIADLGFLTNHRKWGELNTTLAIFGAMMGKKLIERKMSDGSISKIKYRDAWEIIDGQIKLKSGIDASYDKGGVEYNKMVRTIHGVINRVNGAYASFDQPEAGRYLLYRAVMTMKTYFINMFMNRWQFKRVEINGRKLIVPRYDANLGTAVKGYYIEFLQWLAGFFRKTGNKFAFMTDEQKIAARKVGLELFLLIALEQLIVKALFGFDEDDEEKYEKLRQKSGPLPGLFVAEDDHAFNAAGWFSNHMLNLAVQVRAENESWIPWPGMGLRDYINMLQINSVSLKATFDYYADFLTNLYKYSDYLMTGDTKGLYKREVGPYEWQQEGGIKFINNAAKAFGVTGKSVDPIIDIKGLMTREIRD